MLAALKEKFRAAGAPGIFPDIDYATHPYYRDLIAGLTDADRAEALELFTPVHARIVESQQRHAQLRAAQPRLSVPEALRARVERMNDEGILPLRLSDAERNAMVEKTEHAVAALLESRLQKKPEERTVAGVSTLLCQRDQPDALYGFFEELLRAHGIFDICRHHKRLPYQLKFVTLQINQEDDRGIAFKSSYEDGALAKTYYMHIDSPVETLKIMVYRTPDVTADGGAFRYLPTSYRLGNDADAAIRKANDKTNMDMMYTPAKRRKFAALPAKFQKKANFGNDLLGEDDRVRRLLAMERVYGTDQGDLLLFNPEGIHRGAIFTTPSQRQILQMLLVPAV